MRVTAGANAWRTVEGVMVDRRISRKCKETVLSSCMTPAYVNGLETMSLTEKQRKVQVCENTLVGRIVEAKRADKRSIDELRLVVGVKESVNKKLARTRWMTWAGHLERTGDENWQREQMPRKWREKEARKTEIAMCDCIKRD